jgi:hypothetical protein
MLPSLRPTIGCAVWAARVSARSAGGESHDLEGIGEKSCVSVRSDKYRFSQLPTG